MIDFGVSELFVDDEGVINIYGEYESFGPIQKYLEENGLEIVSAEFERIPTDTKDVTAEQWAEIEKLLNKLEEDEDVTQVFHTIGNADDFAE